MEEQRKFNVWNEHLRDLLTERPRDLLVDSWSRVDPSSEQRNVIALVFSVVVSRVSTPFHFRHLFLGQSAPVGCSSFKHRQVALS